VYVQHKVDEDGARILSLLDQGGCIFVCGSTSMAREVQKALIAALIFLRNMSGNRAEAFLEDLAKAGRYHKDVWST
jgi:sulfite reductase alpha subunit-like flavoprotein